MKSSKRLGRIKIATMGLSVITAIFGLYQFFALSRNILRGLNTDVFKEFYLVETHAAVTFVQKLSYSGVLFCILIPTLFAFFFALKVLRHIQRGHIFTTITGRSMQFLGISLGAIIVLDTIFGYFVRSILTWNNTGVEATLADGTLSPGIAYIPPAVYFSSANATILLCGIAFILIGWVWHEGVLIEQENKGFV